jgi:hypothetical protein
MGFTKRRQFSTCLFSTSITYLATLNVISSVLDLQSNLQQGGFWVGRPTAQSHQPPGRAGQPTKSNEKIS